MTTWYPKGTSTSLGVVRETTSTHHSQITAEQRELLDQVLDKWSLQVLDQLCGRSLRFNELERNGMVERVIVGTRPIAVEYRIAPLGKTLQQLIDALLGWSEAHLPEVQRARERFDTQSPAAE
jgi:DNA-binding HxlR family transcriptional regulator